MKKRETSAALISALASVSALAQGVPPSETTSGPQIQRLQQQQLEATKELNPRPNVLTPTGERTSVPSVTNLPLDNPCFPIKEIALEDNTFGWLGRFLQPVVGQCVGKTALKQIQDAANNALIERGYVTSRVLVPTQSLQSGTLTLRVVPGRISEVRADQPTIGWLRAALPTSKGALLNQRDIDQGLENLRRLQSQSDATFDIAPGLNPGDSELVFHPGTGKRWHAVIGTDNAGLDSTGKYELSGSFTFDSPFHLYDQLQIAGTTNANFGASDKGNQSVSANYSVPIGYTMLTLSASRSRYKQTVAGFDAPIEYSGVQSQLQAGLSGVIYRNAHARTELHGNLFHKISRNSLDGVDLPVQHRDIIGYELGIAHRQYIRDVVLDGSFAWRASLPGLSSNSGTVVGSPDFDGKTQVELASVSAQVPFKIGSQAFSYQFGWNMQNARTPLTPSDYFTIGTRYAVRGFDQQLTLAAESGWVVSNELDWYVPTPVGTQALYAGIDAGRVRGPAAQYLLGETLVGAVVGVRGNLAPKNVLGAALNYDVSLGFPLSKPQGFKTSSPTLLFQVSTLF
ncbi:ShlB/FhaC/HecB family hemolysin secretion/activation protein [Burkholderia cenocepacia]|uniref:ShlB/FhaC/HecB family hemolysin secretion/activation protein n=1 Tax=Burkholderia cenocepacia TaxID=95486 RepID=UPI002B245ABD|nr:ShlB/FhaC/HecB family hemolysin secretion/activation protein [Burkholderia cenocepacia]MEB2544550.1 ShlB/FhaC/HecB family hemolysin secretion/activation protein [Burkholderia cenocepacia]